MNNLTDLDQTDYDQLYDSIEAQARAQFKPQFLPSLSPRFKMVVLAVIGAAGVALGSADIPLDPVVTFSTKLGQRSQPYWIVPKGAKVIKSEGSSGFVRGFGWIGGIAAFGGLAHVAGVDVSFQRFVGRLKTDFTQTYFKTQQTLGELRAMATIKKEALTQNKEVNQHEVEENWQFQQFVGYNPPPLEEAQFPQALPYGQPGTYAEINDPSDKVEPSKTVALIDQNDIERPKILPPLTDYPSVLVFGAPGGGKSTFTRKVVKKKQEAGHRVIVLDPHYELGDWEGCEVYGKGMNWKELDEQLLAFANEVKSRYERRAVEANVEFEPLSIVVEEFTTWGLNCKNAGKFMIQICSDIRKVNCFATVVGHANTIAGLGGKTAAGWSNLFKTALLEVEIMARQNPISGRSMPAFKAFVKLPGTPRKNAFCVAIEPDTDSSEPSTFDTSKSVLVADLPDELAGDVWDDPSEKPDSEPSEPAPEPGSDRRKLIETNENQSGSISANPSEPLQGEGSNDSGKRFTILNLEKNEAKALVLHTLRTNNQKQTIESLWACTKGGSPVYKRAKAEFEELVGNVDGAEGSEVQA